MATSRRISIRPAASGDVPLIGALIRELAEYEKAPQMAVATDGMLHQHLFGDSLPGRGPIAECLIGEVEGEPQGLALFFMNFSTWTGRTGVYLEDLFVRPDSRGLGLGRALLAEVAAAAVRRGSPRVGWSVLDWNTPAIEFYKSLGAEAMSEWTSFRVTGDALSRLAASAKGVVQ